MSQNLTAEQIGLFPHLKKGKGIKGGGKVYLTAKAPPSSVFKKGSGNKLLAWFKSHRKFELWERDPDEVKEKCDKRCADEESEEKKTKCHEKCTKKESGWHFWILIHLKKPLNDLELTISFYDDAGAALENPSKNHYYAVKAVDATGGKSAASGTVGEFDLPLEEAAGKKDVGWTER